MDARQSDGAAKSANRELSLISAAWKWALARDLTTVPNPCQRVDKRTEKRRQHYAGDADYDRWIEYCREHGPDYLWIVSEIAYLCRMRKVEVLTALKAQVLPEGFDTLRLKGATDSDEDATVSTGKTPGMSRTYDVSKLRAKPTKSLFV